MIPKCQPSSREDFERACAFTSTFTTEEEWHKYVQENHEKEKRAFEVRLKQMEKTELIISLLMYFTLIVFLITAHIFGYIS